LLVVVVDHHQRARGRAAHRTPVAVVALVVELASLEVVGPVAPAPLPPADVVLEGFPEDAAPPPPEVELGPSIAP